jgi:hypothetical protein
MTDSVTVASSGTHNRKDKCEGCNGVMMARVDGRDRNGQERIEFMFCPDIMGCSEALKAVWPAPSPRTEGTEE